MYNVYSMYPYTSLYYEKINAYISVNIAHFDLCMWNINFKCDNYPSAFN